MSLRTNLFWTILLFLMLGGNALGAAITQNDSTQPRGSPNAANGQGQDLSPVIQGFRAPGYRAGYDSDARDIYFHWAGNMMGNTNRDPAFFATVSVANRDFINFMNAAALNGADTPQDELYELVGLYTPIDVLKALKLEKDIYIDSSKYPYVLQPEDKLPVTADICLRCHAPVGWLEAHSEPPTYYFPFLKGQFWGAAFLEYPGHTAPITVNGSYPNETYERYTGPYTYPGNAGYPRKVNISNESEAEMDGVQCDFCHRAEDNFKRKSRYDGSWIAAGDGGFFVDRYDPFYDGRAHVVYNFQDKGDFCGTCHDVTNPLIKTKTRVSGAVPDMLHPIERTYTEWYWSDYRKESKTCQNCHDPMKFVGAQTWMLYPGLDRLWGELDSVWSDFFKYPVSPNRTEAYKDALRRNKDFMAGDAAYLEFVETPSSASKGKDVKVKVKVTNRAGHKLPTGFAEGRQMWIHIKAVDDSGKVIFEDGVLDSNGYLNRTSETKVYEQVVLAEGYNKFNLSGYNILDANKDSYVNHTEKEFHFVLMNYIEKDNRIPPMGYNKAAYNADGAFIIPHDPKDTDYADGQYWDVTPYTFTIPDWAKGNIRVTATLKYQTFNREYIEFLKITDMEKTVKYGGRSRNIPDGTGTYYGGENTWGNALYKVWQDADRGPPVNMGTAIADITLR